MSIRRIGKHELEYYVCEESGTKCLAISEHDENDKIVDLVILEDDAILALADLLDERYVSELLRKSTDKVEAPCNRNVLKQIFEDEDDTDC